MNQNQSWYAHVDELLAYLRENGKYPPSDSLLGYWVSHQRYAYHHGKLSKARQAFLDLIGFKWKIDEDTRKQSLRKAGSQYYIRTWNERFEELKQYVITHHTFPTSGKIGCWLYQQRHKWRQGNLSEEYKERLETLGVQFWGGEEVSGQMIRDRRAEYEMTQDQLAGLLGMTAMNISKMERSMVPKERLDVILQKMDEAAKKKQKRDSRGKWQKSKRELETYLSEHDGVYPASDSKLGEWVADQRFLKKSGLLDAKQIAQLNEMGFAWHPRTAKDQAQVTNPREAWDASYEQVRQFVAEHGVLPAAGDGKIGIWVYQQKYRYTHGRLPEKRKKMLEEIGVVFDDARQE